MPIQEFWDSCAQNRTSKISKNALPRILGLLGAEQDVGNLNNYTSRHVKTGDHYRHFLIFTLVSSGGPGTLPAEAVPEAGKHFFIGASPFFRPGFCSTGARNMLQHYSPEA